MFLTDNIKLDGIPNKVKLNEKYKLVFILFHQFFYFSLFSINLYINRYQILQLFSTSFNTIWKKIFVTSFSFFNRFSPFPNLLNGQDPLSITKVCFFDYICYLAVHRQFWATVEETASLIQCQSLHFSYSDSKVTRSFYNESFLSMLPFLGFAPSRPCYASPWIRHWTPQDGCFWDYWGKKSWGLAIQSFPEK